MQGTHTNTALECFVMEYNTSHMLTLKDTRNRVIHFELTYGDYSASLNKLFIYYTPIL